MSVANGTLSRSNQQEHGGFHTQQIQYQSQHKEILEMIYTQKVGTKEIFKRSTYGIKTPFSESETFSSISDMESAKLEAQINEYMSELAELNFGDLDKLEKLLLTEFRDNADETDFSIWTDCFREQLEDLDLAIGNNEKFKKFLIKIGVIDTHVVCGPYYYGDNQFTPDELDKIADLPLCEEDNGRSDSCYGVHFFITLQPDISEKTLKKLLKIDHYDEGFFPWLVARSNATSPELLAEIADNFTYTTTWRIEGEYREEGSGLITSAAQTFVLWNIANNPNTPQDTLLKYKTDIKNLMGSSEEELLALLEKSKGNAHQESMDKLKQFEDETAHLESDFIKWLERIYSATPLLGDDLFEDDFEELENENDENFKKLTSLWIALPDRRKIGVSEEGARWELAGVRLPIELRKIEGAPPSFIDLLFAEVLPASGKGLFARNKQDTLTGRWKVSILRTGGVSEYMKAEVDEELAWKMSVVADGQNIKLSKIVGEVVWARALEFEYPLSEYTPDEIEKFAKAYIQKRSQ